MPKRSNEPGAGRAGSRFIIRDYNRMVQSAELQDIRLVASEFSVSPEYYKREDDMEMILSDDIPWVNYDQDKKVAMTSIQWRAACSRDDEVLLETTASYLLAYNFSESAETKYVETFIRNVGRFAVYPYFRALVAHFSAAASANLPVLPVIKQPIAPPPDDDHEEERRERPARRRPSRPAE